MEKNELEFACTQFSQHHLRIYGWQFASDFTIVFLISLNCISLTDKWWTMYDEQWMRCKIIPIYLDQTLVFLPYALQSYWKQLPPLFYFRASFLSSKQNALFKWLKGQMDTKADVCYFKYVTIIKTFYEQYQLYFRFAFVICFSKWYETLITIQKKYIYIHIYI